MKITILLLTICIMTTTGMAGTKNINVPVPVLKAFASQYKGNTVKKWAQRGDTLVAAFKADREMHFAYYLPDGTWLETRTNIRWTWRLPKRVQHSFDHSPYAPWKIDDIYQVEKTDSNYYTITVVLEKGPEGAIPGDVADRNRLYFKPDGTIYKTDTVTQAAPSLQPVISNLLGK